MAFVIYSKMTVDELKKRKTSLAAKMENCHSDLIYHALDNGIKRINEELKKRGEC